MNDIIELVKVSLHLVVRVDKRVNDPLTTGFVVAHVAFLLVTCAS